MSGAADQQGGLAAPLPQLKLCTGCDRKLPATNEHWFFRDFKPTGRCRECRARVKTKHDGPYGTVPAQKVYPLVLELVQRYGTQEKAAEAAGVSETTIGNIMLRRRKTMQKRNVRLIVLALHERRKFDRMNGSSARYLEARQYQGKLEEKINRLAGY